jgi:hypothetical protein
VEALLYNARATVRAVGVRPTSFWDLWCQFVEGVDVDGRDGCAVEVVGVVGGGFGYAMVVGGWCWADDGCDRVGFLSRARQYTAAP